VGSNPTRRTIPRQRTREEIAAVQALAAEGLNYCQIARRTGIPRSTLHDWLNGRVPRRPHHEPACSSCGHAEHRFDQLPAAEYAYLLAMYLGDGCISTSARGIHRLRIFLDMRYPNIIIECVAAMRAVMPSNAVHVQHYVGGGNAAEVGSSSKSWPCLFPQHGRGRKHQRAIVLRAWQQEIVDRHPKPFLRGFIHSDGCRVINKSMGREYVRYFFIQASDDIRSMFCDACDRLGIAWRHPKARTISVARRDSVALLDTFIGPKT
jgi:Homeodomain-like domain